MRWLAAAMLAALPCVGGMAQEMPVIPPPGSAPRTPPAPRQVLPQGSLSIEALAGQGFEVKAMERAHERGADFVVLMQRGGEVRSCLLRIVPAAGGVPQRQSGCF